MSWNRGETAALWQQEDVSYRSCHRIDWIFCRGLTSIWPCLCLGFIQPAAARLLFSFSFFFTLAFAVTSHSFLPPRFLFESPNVFGCRLLFASAGSLAAQPTNPHSSRPPGVQQGDEHVTFGQTKLPCFQWGGKWNTEKETYPPKKYKKKKKKEWAMMSVFPPTGPPPNTPFQPQYFIVKLCIFSTGLSLWESWFDLIRFFWGGGFRPASCSHLHFRYTQCGEKTDH